VEFCLFLEILILICEISYVLTRKLKKKLCNFETREETMHVFEGAKTFKMGRVCTIVCLLFVMALLAGACGDSKKDTEDASVVANITQADFCPEIARILCTNLFWCCTNSELQDLFEYHAQMQINEESCLGDVELACDRRWTYYKNAMETGTTTLDEDAANACLDQLRAKKVIKEVEVDGEIEEVEEVQCVEVIPAEDFEQACMDVPTDWFTGNVEPGGDCFPPFDEMGEDVECAEDSFCDVETYMCEALLALGEECVPFAGIDCATGLHCGEEDGDAGVPINVCVEDLPVGADCMDDPICEEGLYCDYYSAVPPPLLCTVEKADGEGCVNGGGAECVNACLPGICDDDMEDDCWSDDDCALDVACIPGGICGLPPMPPAKLEQCENAEGFIRMFRFDMFG
jgi:hypothetical protein